MSTSRQVYAQKALSQIPRLLGNQDRNPFSPTYGCFHRDYWLDKTSDFPDAVRQFSVQALALVYRRNFPGSIYYHQTKIRDWAIAGLDFWAHIQHRDGSFDEFYPYERGWVGPTAFTTFTSTEAYNLLQDEIPSNVAERVRAAISKAAYFIAAGESEEDHLANHYAMACLAVWKAYELLGEPDLKRGFEHLWQGFLGYHNEEGWSREYDGVDPGYLSATVSFLAKIYQKNPDPEILKVLQQSVEFCSYFVYPNGFYAGSMGSRNTLHFYPHGFEVLAGEIPLASAVAEKMLWALGEDKLVPPEIISDRYVVYRVPEFLQAYLDYTERSTELPLLPYERPPFNQYFQNARIAVANSAQHYVIANLAKGGVVKVFDRQDGKLLLNDCGLIGQLSDGRRVSSQWIDPAYECQVDENGWSVAGSMHVIPSNKLFTPLKNILFRSALVALGWNSTFSHLLKAQIRKVLILGKRRVPIRFQRHFLLEGGRLALSDVVAIDRKLQFSRFTAGGEFFVRYVPQSRYFQAQELEAKDYPLDAVSLETLNQEHRLTLRRELLGSQINCSCERETLPKGVYDVDYFVGRQKKRQLVYRLQRRTDEVEAALQKYGDGRLNVIVDVGTADGLMLKKLHERLGDLMFLGVDYGFALLASTTLDGVHKTQGDALALPVASGKADAVIATAVIEHVPDAAAMLRECRRVLRLGGLLIMTTPDPLMDRVASAVGLLKESGHQETFNLKELRRLFEASGFEVLEARKFMFSPVGFPAEKSIERFLGPLGLSLIMANQLIVGKHRG